MHAFIYQYCFLVCIYSSCHRSLSFPLTTAITQACNKQISNQQQSRVAHLLQPQSGAARLKKQIRMSALLSLSSAVSSATESCSYTDAHAHLFHRKFSRGEQHLIAMESLELGVDRIVVNGLEPISNRQTLELAKEYSNILPALGIYPLDATCRLLHENPSYWVGQLSSAPDMFDVDAEIAFIDRMASEGVIVAVGECGLDRHFINLPDVNAEQERVLRELMRIAKRWDIPVILHTRKAEERIFEILIEEDIQKADLHCFCGSAILAARMAVERDYYFSIPTAVERVKSFQELARLLPLNRILTETDCPYQGPDKGKRNDPRTIPRGVKAIAESKGLTIDDTRQAIRQNFHRLFNR